MPTSDSGVPAVLELRIHGVNNTPPSNMLNFPADDITQCDGDPLGSFWTPKPEAIGRSRLSARGRWTNLANDAVTPGEKDWVPPDYVDPTVRREAYSWGAQARSTAHVPGAGDSLAARAAKAAWLLLIPLSVTNAAYWSRRLKPDRRPESTGSDQTKPPREYGRGQRPVLLFAVGLTLLFTSALQTAALDVVATQCFSDPAGFTTCPQLPTWLHGLSSLTWGQRVALLSLVPLAGLLLLRWVSSSGQVRFHVTGRPGSPEANPNNSRQIPILSQPDMWQRWRLAARATRIHMAAGVSLITGTLAAVGLWGSTSECLDLKDLGTEACTASSPRQWLYVAPLTVALIIMIGVGALLMDRGRPAGPSATDTRQPNRTEDSTNVDSRAAAALRWELAAFVGFAAVTILLWVDDNMAVERRLPGLSFTPTSLVTALFLTACIAATWRHSAVRTIFATGGAVAAAAGLLALAWPAEGWAPWIPIGVGLLVLLSCAVPWRPWKLAKGWLGTDPEIASEAWLGTAPGVFLLLALGLQMLLCSTVLVVLGDWLNGSDDAADLFAPSVVGSEESHLRLPPSYAAFLACTTVVLALMLVVALGVAFRLLQRSKDADKSPHDQPSDVMNVRQRAASLADLIDDETSKDVLGARNRADVLQRGESLLGGFAVALGIALAGTVLVLPGHGWVAEQATTVVSLLTTVGVWIAVGAWLLVVARVLTKDAPARPLGLLWDLACFLPRTAHPFGPPCYAERAVPELISRVDAWLMGADLPEASTHARGRRVVLAPHSMGVVLAVAALMQPHRTPWRGRVALLTYGTQLRPYFGRYFPELLGPAPIGNEPVKCADFTHWCWNAQELPAPGDPPGPTLAEILLSSDDSEAPLWISLWRRTDPLGMRVGLRRVDKEAEEVDGSRYLAEVAAHSDYPNTVTYRRAFDALRAVLSIPLPKSEKFVSVTRATLLDSSIGTGPIRPSTGSDYDVDLQVTGRGGVPVTRVAKVALEVTATLPSSGGHVSVFPRGDGCRSGSFWLGDEQDGTIVTRFEPRVGAGGKVGLQASPGTQLSVTVLGYYPATAPIEPE